MDPQDNTFPIPPAENAGGSIPPAQQPAAAQPANPFAAQTPSQVPDPLTGVPMPMADPNAVTPPQPAPAQAPLPQPEWQTQAQTDAAGLPAGPDNPSLTAPNTPLPAGPSPAQTDNYVISPFSSSPAAEQQPVPATPPQPAPAPAVIPDANTLDLSNQPALTPQPVQPGTMQPGVDVSPAPAPTPVVADQSFNTPPPAQVEQPMSGGLPTDLGTSYNSDITDMAMTDTTRKKGPLKFIIIVVAALALMIILSLVLVFSARNQRKPAIELNDQTVQTQTTATQPAALPDGYKQVVRDCYSFGIVSQTTIDFAKTACNIGAKFGANSQYSITVTPSTAAVGDLTTFSNTLKAGTPISNDKIQLNNIDAVKIVQSVNGTTQQVIAVIPTGKNYTFNGAPVTAFTITTSYNDDASKTVSDNIVKTWAWK